MNPLKVSSFYAEVTANVRKRWDQARYQKTRIKSNNLKWIGLVTRPILRCSEFIIQGQFIQIYRYPSINHINYTITTLNIRLCAYAPSNKQLKPWFIWRISWTRVAEVVEDHFHWEKEITGLKYFIYCWMSVLKQDFLCKSNSILSAYRCSFSPCDVQAAGAYSRLQCNCSNQFKSLKYNEICEVVITHHFYCILELRGSICISSCKLHFLAYSHKKLQSAYSQKKTAHLPVI